MRWRHENHGLDHEGFVRGQRHDGSGYRDSASDERYSHACQAECTCGWRSPRWRLHPTTPGLTGPEISAEDEERACALWLAHIAQLGQPRSGRE